MGLRMYCQRCYVRNVPRTVSTAAAQRERDVYEYADYSTERVVTYSSSNSSSDGAGHELSTLLRTVCTTHSIYSSSCCGLTFLSSYAVGHRIILSYSTPEVFMNKQNSNIIIAGNHPGFGETRISLLTHTPTSTFSHYVHPANN